MSFRGVASIVGVILVLWGGWSFYKWIRSDWIPAGYVGVMYSAQTGLENKVYTPKRVFVPWFHQLYIYPSLTKVAAYSQDASAGENNAADGIQVTTNDNAITTFDVTVYYRVRPEDVFTVFKTFGAIDIDDIQRLHIRRAVKEAANVAGTECDAFTLMGRGREHASLMLTQELRKRLAPKGITVENAIFCEAFPTEQLQTRVIRQVNSLTNLTIATIHQQQADVERQTAVVKATAETKAAAISAAKTLTRSFDLLKLEADQLAIAKWDGHLPAMRPRQGQNILVNADSFTSWLNAAAPPQQQQAEAAAPEGQEASQ
jgi:regulator of protease activity HflC (stomatin/prohibitin superfamily)